MKTFCVLLLLIVSFHLQGQKEDQINMDILKAPASPASNLLDIATTDISKPTDVADLMISIRNFPINFVNSGGYSIEIAPYWIFSNNKNSKTVKEMLNSNIKNTLKQTFVFSFAARNIDETKSDLPGNSIYTGVGIKFSLFRGEPSKKTIENFDTISVMLDKRTTYIANEITSKILKNNKYIEAVNKRNIIKNPESVEYRRADATVQKVFIDLKTEYIKKDEYIVKTSEKLSNITFEIKRYGFLWDFAGGTSIQFKEKRFNNSKIYNAGLWTVLGYATENNGTPLLLLRYMYNPKSDWMTVEDFKSEGNFSTFDAGVKYEFSPKDSKFTGSLEGLYRSFISGSDLKPTWKCVLNLDYAIFANQHLTLSLGKDFDNNIIKKGNVIAGLSFLSGIGTKRKIQ